MSVEEALSLYGLTREDLYREAIIWLGSVPEHFAWALMYDPPNVAGYIKRWDFYFSTGMTSEYPERRGEWTLQSSIREFIQNALDAEEDAFGYDNIKVKVYVDPNLGLCIRDRGKGFTRDAWRLGGSEKPSWMRGHFGEGMKVASAYLAKRDITPYVFTKDDVYKVVRAGDLILVVMGKSRTYVDGTLVCIPQISDTSLASGIVFNEILDKYKRTCEAKGVKPLVVKLEIFGRPNFILVNASDVGMADMLYVRDIYVNTFTKMSSFPSLFTYNIWWVELHPNRVDVASLTSLSNEVRDVWLKVEDREVAEAFLDKILTEEPSELRVKHGYFETEDVWWKPGTLSFVIAKILTEKYPSIGRTEREGLVEWFKYMGVFPVLIHPSRMEDLFVKVPRAEEVITKKRVTSVKEAEVVKPSELTWSEHCMYKVMEIFLELLNAEYMKSYKLIVKSGIDSEAFASPEGIIGVNRDALKSYYTKRDIFETSFKIIGHEFAHLLSEKRDLDPAFVQRILGAVYSRLFGIITASYEVFRKANRAARGCMNPKREFFDLILSIAETINVDIKEVQLSWAYSDLAYGMDIPAVIAYMKGEIHTSKQLSTIVHELGNIPVSMVKDAYMSYIKREIVKLVKQGCDLSKIAWYDIYEDIYKSATEFASEIKD